MRRFLLCWCVFLAIGQSYAQSDSGVIIKQPLDSIKRLKEVVITGQFEPQSLKSSVYNVRVIDAKRIKLRSATDLKTLLATELGLRFSNDPATGISDLQLMGMDGAGVKIMLDGVPMMDRGTSKESLGQIDVNTIERIEIVEGPMSVVYGSDAMAGVINVITKKGFENRFLVNARILEESAGSEYSAFDKKGTHNGNLGINYQTNGWQFGASGTRNNFGGWQGGSQTRTMEWLPKEQFLATANVGYKKDKIDVWYRLSATDETLHYLGDINTNTQVAPSKDYLSKRFFHQAQASYTLSEKWSFNGAASYTDYSRRTLSTNLDLNTGKETLATDLGSQDKDVFGSTFFRGTALYKLSPAVSFQPGVEFNNNSGSGGRIVGSPQINDYAVFLSSQIQLGDAVQLRPGLRLVRNSVYDAPPVIPSLNAKIKLTDQIDFRAAYARGYRAPILRELYFVFKDSSHDIVGNENLKAETSDSFNGSISWNLKEGSAYSFRTILSGFYNNFKDRIDIGLDAKMSTSNVYLNIAKFKTTGAEWNNTFGFGNLQATVGLAYIGRYNQYTESSDTPDFMWTPELNTNLTYEFPKIGTSLGFFYKFNGKRPTYIVSQGAAGAAPAVLLSEVGAFHLADLTASKTVNKLLSLNAGVRNLFDVTRLQNTNGGTEAHSIGSSVPMGFGRSFFLGLTMQFSKN
jgi:outer membrane receptor for ferrienterochelin and colicins